IASSFSYYYSHPKIRLVPLDVVRDVRDVASRPATTNHSPGRRRARQLVFGAYCCSGTLPDQFWVGKFPCAGSAKLAPIPRSLDASKWCAGIGASEIIDKYHSGFDLAGNATGPDEVTAPDRSAETEVSDIGEVNRLVVGLEGENHSNGTKEFFLGDRRLGRQPYKHSRRIEIAGAGGDLTASENACPSLYRVEHLAMEVLAGTGEGQWADLDAFLHGIAHWKRLRLFDKRFGEVVKQRLRHQETLGANATLAVVEVARRHGQLHGFRKICVLQNDEWIRTAEFQHHSLAGSGRFLRNGAAGADAGGDGGGPHTRIGDDRRNRRNVDCKVDIESFGATGVAHQGLQRLGAALDRFGVLDERGIADKGCGVEEAQHLPEGYVPRLNGEDRPYRFIDDPRRYAGDGLWLEINLPRLGEVTGGPGGFLDLENGVRQRL